MLRIDWASFVSFDIISVHYMRWSIESNVVTVVKGL